MSGLEKALAAELERAGLPKPEPQYRFCGGRRWRFDFAWPALRLAVEVEGGLWIRGRHTHPKGFEADCEKYNTAALFGWRVLRFVPDQVHDGRALATIRAALEEPNG